MKRWGQTPRNARFTGLSAISALGTAPKYVFARVLENCRDGQPLPRRALWDNERIDFALRLSRLLWGHRLAPIL